MACTQYCLAEKLRVELNLSRQTSSISNLFGIYSRHYQGNLMLSLYKVTSKGHVASFMDYLRTYIDFLGLAAKFCGTKFYETFAKFIFLYFSITFAKIKKFCTENNFVLQIKIFTKVHTTKLNFHEIL